MVAKNPISIVLLLRLLLCMHALRDVSVYAHQGMERNGNSVPSGEENIMSIMDNIGVATLKVALGGRKLARDLKLNDEVVNKVKMPSEPKITNEQDGYSQRVVLEDQAANKEMVTLMHKDYEGMNKPHHKIPINN